VRSRELLRALPKLAAIEALLPPLPAGAEPPTLTPAVGKRRGRAGLLTGCVQRFFYADVNRDTVRLLAAAGYDVVVPRGQPCCGALHLHAGRLGEFRRMAGDLVASFPGDLDVLVVNAAGCGSALKEYAHWLPGAQAFAGVVKDVSEALVDSDLPLRERRQTVAYHDACHLAHGQRVRQEPRLLLRKIPGLALVELPGAELCCGSAGVYNLLEPRIAEDLGRRTAERIRQSGARVVASANPGCLMQIRRHCRAEGLDIEVVHPVSLLARAMGET
jgi:glycolate oxidase iron-sulfur subunit